MKSLIGSATVSGSDDLSSNGTFTLNLNPIGTPVVTSSDDNKLQFPAPTNSSMPAFFDQAGLGFNVNGVNYDLFGVGEGFTGYGLNDDGHIPFGSPTVSVTAAVPEPSTWTTMMLGFCGLGFLALRNRATTKAA